MPPSTVERAVESKPSKDIPRTEESPILAKQEQGPLLLPVDSFCECMRIISQSLDDQQRVAK